MNSQNQAIAHQYELVRRRSEMICAPLCAEDYVPQPAVEVSPPKWHLGHSTWFFETLVLGPHLAGYVVHHPSYGYIFNSYYESQGERVLRAHRGALSRPTIAEVISYRLHVDASIRRLLKQAPEQGVLDLITLGIQHEQQHQELLLTDIKYILGSNPLRPPYWGNEGTFSVLQDDSRRVSMVGREASLNVATEHACEPHAHGAEWIEFSGGLIQIGHGGAGFAYDNEGPRHTAYVAGFQLRASLVKNKEYLAFMHEGGYRRFELWHAEGWDWVQANKVSAPLYWRCDGGTWLHYTLQGELPLLPGAPVSHISLFEALAFCKWAGWRLPTEFEWEALCPGFSWGRRWEWTSSAYLPYPGYRGYQGAALEYNGKFMLNQTVLRGSSFATPAGHARKTYRNFFHPPLRWQYTGIRPARDL
jgi:ergothioneine biosynthesis protein EgtB